MQLLCLLFEAMKLILKTLQKVAFRNLIRKTSSFFLSCSGTYESKKQRDAAIHRDVLDTLHIHSSQALLF